MDDTRHRLRVHDLVITDELGRRPSHEPDHGAENRALRALAGVTADGPGEVLQAPKAVGVAPPDDLVPRGPWRALRDSNPRPTD